MELKDEIKDQLIQQLLDQICSLEKDLDREMELNCKLKNANDKLRELLRKFADQDLHQRDYYGTPIYEAYKNKNQEEKT